MIVGDPSLFAIESEVTEAYESLGSLALGFFVLHVGGHCYGVRSLDATLLACSFGAVNRRIEERGRHQASFAAVTEGRKLADAVRLALYADIEDDIQFYGLASREFSDVIHSNELLWAPDGDEAFDDSSYVLQFDVGAQVRVIAFQCGDSFLPDPSTLRDIWLTSDDFYGILQRWRDAFEADWAATPKVRPYVEGPL
jgi:Immunity protein 42